MDFHLIAIPIAGALLLASPAASTAGETAPPSSPEAPSAPAGPQISPEPSLPAPYAEEIIVIPGEGVDDSADETLLSAEPAEPEPAPSAVPPLPTEPLPWGSDLEPPVPIEPPVPAQEASPDKPWWRRNLFSRFWSDQKFLIVHWWPSEFRHTAFTAPLLAGTFAAARSDESGGDLHWERQFDANTTGSSQRMFEKWSSIGNPAFVALGMGGSWLVAHFSHSSSLMRATSLTAEALLSEGVYVEVLKHTMARTRPDHGGTGEFFTYSPKNGQSSTSFPSGHAMGAFTVATVFSQVYANHKWFPWVAYGSAAMIGISRVALGRHFPSDVVVGSVLGNSIGRMVIARDTEENPRPLALSHFHPIADPVAGQYGVGWSYSWGGARPAAK